jgi:hypothetical protein
MDFYKRLLFNANRDLVFMLKPTYIFRIVEDNTGNSGTTFVPRFSLKNADVFDDFPANTPVKFDEKLILKAIQWGMIIQIDYKGDEDAEQAGHVRTIYPMVLGQSKDGKLLIRGYHLNGWSVSKGGNLEKEWRLFRCDRILNMTFTGAFFRLAPDGYNTQGDKTMTKILGQADFDSIRNKQTELLNKSQIDTLDRVILNKIRSVEAKDLNYNLKLFNPWDANIIPKKDAKSIRITFAKPIVGSGQWIAIVGTSIEPNNIFKLKADGKEVGSYKSVKWVMANELDNMKTLEQQVEFKTYMFIKGI